MARSAHTYRGARRNLAKRFKVKWAAAQAADAADRYRRETIAKANASARREVVVKK